MKTAPANTIQATTAAAARRWSSHKLNRWQKLLTAAQLRSLPALYAQDGKGMNATAYVKFFCGGLTWFATEFDPADGLFFGLCVNHSDLSMSELGYFSAEEISARQVPSIARQHDGSFRMTPVVERDLHFTPCTLAEAFKQLTGRQWELRAVQG